MNDSNQKTKDLIYSISVVALFFFFSWALGTTRSVVIVSFLVAYILSPMIVRLRKWGIQPWVSLSLVVILNGSLVAVLAAWLAPLLLQELQELGKNLPGLIDTLVLKVEHWMRLLSEHFPSQKIDLGQWLREEARNIKTTPLIASVPKILTSGIDVFRESFNYILFPILTLYFLYDFERIQKLPRQLTPDSLQAPLEDFWNKSNEIFHNYLRGMLLVSLFLSTTYSIGLVISGIPYGLLIGLASGLLCIVPYLGFMVGFAGTLLLCLLIDASLFQWVGVAVTFTASQLIEGNFITPRVVGRRVGLHPLATLLFIIIGGNLYGILGMFLSIPLGTLIWETLTEKRFRKD